jgi:phosphatidylglycerol---prolipoprotein diacylglyceryl transferase
LAFKVGMHPSIFEIGPIDIRFYSLMYILAMGLGFYLLAAEVSRKKLPLSKNDLVNLILFSVVVGIIGARLYYVIFRWDYYSVNLAEIPAIRQGGLASHGGFIAGAAAGWLFLRRHRVPFLKLADSALPLVVLGEACIRFGNFMNGEVHGLPTTMPWGVVFPPGSPAGNHFPGIPVHPTMLYQLFYDLFVFAIVWFVLRKKPFRDGFVAAFTVVLYSAGRFFIEGLRADSLYLGHFRVAQIVCIVLLLAMISVIIAGRPWMRNPSAIGELDAQEGSINDRIGRIQK